MVSGGNTLLLDPGDYTKTEVLGGNEGHAAGECLDMVARVLASDIPRNSLT
jgi:tRNA A37 threonylcarbamoyltransferase TsaD